MGESITYDDMLEDFEYYYPHLASNVVEAYQKRSRKQTTTRYRRQA